MKLTQAMNDFQFFVQKTKKKRKKGLWNDSEGMK